MPLALDPSATRRLHLRSDAQIEAAKIGPAKVLRVVKPVAETVN